ncbi:hypothetical protein ABMX69_11000 [Vibrio vulnificus]|uniref:hypothetical protein n=1 Tax=Vibrio vulnificus TaxID=672 RepID=UPI000CD0F654
MTLNEYLNHVEEKLLQSGSKEEAISIVETAQETLTKSAISDDSQKQFWIDLYEKLGGDLEVALEKQGGDALSNIISAAKKVIADKAKK